MLINLADMLKVARKNHFAVPAFNTSSNMILTGVMQACKEKNSPVIIAIHPDELSFVRDSFVSSVIEEAQNATFPVCIHLDHGSTLDQVIRAIKCGFTSVMIDSSTTSFEDNISITKKVVEIAHAVNISVEAELGTIGASDDKNGEAGTDKIIYTNPLDVVKFIEATKIDALAVAIGTAHGLYPKDITPKLRLDLLEEIRALTDIPLVLHGGSDNSDTEIAESVKYGICKINISSDIKSAFYKKCREILENPTLREPNAIYPPCIAEMKKIIYHKINLFGSSDASRYY